MAKLGVWPYPLYFKALGENLFDVSLLGRCGKLIPTRKSSKFQGIEQKILNLALPYLCRLKSAIIVVQYHRGINIDRCYLQNKWFAELRGKITSGFQ